MTSPTPEIGEDRQSVGFACPRCGAGVTVSQVQGDRCAGCGCEFKWFAPNERRAWRDYFASLTGAKERLELTPPAGYIVAHD